MIRFVREATRVSLWSSECPGEGDSPSKIARDGTGMRPFVQESAGLGGYRGEGQGEAQEVGHDRQQD